jgi:hypothetical protein
MQSTRIVMGRGNVSTSHGQIKILKHSTPDLVTYIQRAVKSGVYRSNEEIEEMNKKLKENPTDLRRVRWNVHRGSKITDYPKEYEILTLNPPAAFKPRMPVKDQKKMFNKYIREDRPMDRLVNGYLNREASSKKNSDGISADDYYRRLLGSNKAPGTAMGSKSATLAKAYAVAVKQYHMMRTENLSEKEALEKVSLAHTVWCVYIINLTHPSPNLVGRGAASARGLSGKDPQSHRCRDFEIRWSCQGGASNYSSRESLSWYQAKRSNPRQDGGLRQI